MSQTLKFAVDIDQSKMSSAVNTLQSSLNTQMQQGALQLSGMYNGLGQVMANMQMQMGQAGVHATKSMAYSLAPEAMYQQGVQPFRSQREAVEGYFKESMDTVKQTAKMATITFANKLNPPTPGFGQWLGSKATQLAVESAVSWPIMSAGGVLAKSVLGLTGLSGTVAGMAGGYLMASPVNNILRKVTNPLINQLWGVEDPNDPKVRAKYQAMSNRLQAGASALQLSGYRIGPSKPDQERFYQMSQGMGAFVENYAARRGIATRDALSVMQATDLMGYGNMADLRRSLRVVSTAGGKTRFDIMGDTAKLYERGMERTEREMVRAGGIRAVSTKIDFDRYLDYNQRKAMAPSWWDVTGDQMGTSMRIGKQFGRELMRTIQPIATSKDQYLNQEERRWLGHSKGIGATYGQLVGASFRPGGVGYLGMAALAQGINPANLMQQLPNIAAAYSNPGEIIRYNARHQHVMRAAGGKAAEAIYASNMLQQAKFMQGIIGGRSTVTDILTNMYMGKGMDPTQARAQAAMTARQGRRLVYAGDGQGVVDQEFWLPTAKEVLLAQGHTGGATLEKDARSLLTRIGGRAATTSRMLQRYASRPHDLANARTLARKLKAGDALNASDMGIYKNNKDLVDAFRGLDAKDLQNSEAEATEALKMQSLTESAGKGFAKGALLATVRPGVNFGKDAADLIKIAQDFQQLKRTDPKQWERLRYLQKNPATSVVTAREYQQVNVLNQLESVRRAGQSLDQVVDQISGVSKQEVQKAITMDGPPTSAEEERDRKDLIGVLNSLHDVLARLSRSKKVRI